MAYKVNPENNSMKKKTRLKTDSGSNPPEDQKSSSGLQSSPEKEISPENKEAENDVLVKNTKGYIHTIDKATGQEVILNKKKNYNKYNRNKLASRLASMDLDNAPPADRKNSQNQENRESPVSRENGGAVLGMSDANTEHQSPFMVKQLRSNSIEKDEDEEYLDKLLPQARKVNSDQRSKSSAERPSR